MATNISPDNRKWIAQGKADANLEVLSNQVDMLQHALSRLVNLDAHDTAIGEAKDVVRNRLTRIEGTLCSIRCMFL